MGKIIVGGNAETYNASVISRVFSTGALKINVSNVYVLEEGNPSNFLGTNENGSSTANINATQVSRDDITGAAAGETASGLDWNGTWTVTDGLPVLTIFAKKIAN